MFKSSQKNRACPEPAGLPIERVLASVLILCDDRGAETDWPLPNGTDAVPGVALRRFRPGSGHHLLQCCHRCALDLWIRRLSPQLEVHGSPAPVKSVQKRTTCSQHVARFSMITVFEKPGWRQHPIFRLQANCEPRTSWIMTPDGNPWVRWHGIFQWGFPRLEPCSFSKDHVVTLQWSSAPGTGYQPRHF